ncbi:hypothetical protein PIB30_022058 [Stylosanthes scabra]|uniref:X8 domain-containing protein n=1 Tax=Stylosanthes scabra TaxID=79078 RepID=A0ABU6Z8I4_9FABA|nr:hypothetical protein [Stylosanthes scabra]
METSVNYYVIMFLLLSQFLCSGSYRTMKVVEETRHVNVLLVNDNAQIFTTQKDITTPIATFPNLIPTTPTFSSNSPLINPNSNPDSTVSPSSSSSTTIPITPPTTVVNPSSPVSSGASWCIASPSASQTSLQVALDYACGYGGDDCSAIQPGGICYIPNTIQQHASYAFNKYYLRNPVPNSCNFGGAAIITNTNPSTTTCQYPSTSTSSSVLNTTNSIGANVFGSVPVPTNPSPSSASPPEAYSHTYAIFCVTLWMSIFILL